MPEKSPALLNSLDRDKTCNFPPKKTRTRTLEAVPRRLAQVIQHTYFIHIIEEMADDLSSDWDPANLKHIARHRIGPTDMAQAFANETIDLNYEVTEGEERWTSIGHPDGLGIIVIVWTMRGDSIRTVFDAGESLTEQYLVQKGWGE